MGLLDWFKPKRNKKPEETPPVEKASPKIKERVEGKPKRAKRKRKSV